MVAITAEHADDTAGIRAVHRAAFPTPDEGRLVDALRGTAAWLPDLSVVARDGSEVIGHLLLTRAHLDTGTPVLALAPMAVVPGRQGSGVGGQLVTAGRERARGATFPLIVVLGHPEFYGRFGFTPAAPLRIAAPFPVPEDAWMAATLPSYTRQLRGTVVYPPPFDAL